MKTSQPKVSVQVQISSMEELSSEAAILPIFQGPMLPPSVRDLDRRLGGLIRKHVERDRFRGELHKTLWVDGGGTRMSRVLLTGLGEKKVFTRSVLRDAYRTAAKEVLDQKLERVSLPYLSGSGFDGNFEAALEGFWLNLYRFNKYKKDEAAKVSLRSLSIVAASKSEAQKIEKKLERIRVLVTATHLAQDLVNEPANVVTPTYMEKKAAEISKDAGLKIRVLGEAELKKFKMNLILAVGDGSSERPRMVHFEYRPKGKPRRSVALVGKGVTFDSGGLSLKPQESMYGMKCDMAGAAAVFGAMWAIGHLKPSTAVHGFVPLVENLPSAHSSKPGDVVVGYNGKSVEIENTDAEGRLILADALAYAQEFKVDEILDAATLTGACIIALGTDMAGIVSNNSRVVSRVEKAAALSGEKVWELPFETSYLRMLKSDVADLRNVAGRYGGAITAGLFLSEFVTMNSWAHLDIAGPAFFDKEAPWGQKGGTGFGVRTFVEFVS